MGDPECVAFLQWALPRLGLAWPGFRRVRGQVCKRLGRRLQALGLADLDAYRTHLQRHGDEWALLDGLCRVSVSRFYRDRAVFDALRDHVLPGLAAASPRTLRALSAGCAGGEEPYTLALVWQQALAPRFPSCRLEIVATDADPRAIERARRACYAPSSLRELPARWRDAAFLRRGDAFCLVPEARALVELRCEDLRTTLPPGPFDLVLCRNLVFTYFDAAARAATARQLRSRLARGGLLVVGVHERLDAPAELGLRLSAACPGGYEVA